MTKLLHNLSDSPMFIYIYIYTHMFCNLSDSLRNDASANLRGSPHPSANNNNTNNDNNNILILIYSY